MIPSPSKARTTAVRSPELDRIRAEQIAHKAHVARLEYAKTVDEIAIPAMNGGTKEEMATLLVALMPLALQLGIQRLRSYADAQDAMQDSLWAVVKYGHTFNRELRFTTWFYTVHRNVCLRILRGWARFPQLVLPAGGEAKEFASDWFEPSTLVIEAERARRIGNAIQSLPPDLISAVKLYYLGDDSQDEAARKLGLSRGAFRRRLAEVVSTLSAKLQDYDANGTSTKNNTGRRMAPVG